MQDVGSKIKFCGWFHLFHSIRACHSHLYTRTHRAVTNYHHLLTLYSCNPNILSQSVIRHNTEFKSQQIKSSRGSTPRYSHEKHTVNLAGFYSFIYYLFLINCQTKKETQIMSCIICVLGVHTHPPLPAVSRFLSVFLIQYGGNFRARASPKILLNYKLELFLSVMCLLSYFLVASSF